MLIRVVTTVLLMVLYCRYRSAETEQINPAYSAIYNFYPEKVPLSYEFQPLLNHQSHSRNHRYTPQQSKHHKQKFNAMQYAPLHQLSEDNIIFPNAKQSDVNNAHIVPDLDAQEITKERLDLKPRKVSIITDTASYKPFILGHNIEVLQSVSRSPGHNPAYRSYPDGSHKRHDKVNLLRQYVINKIPIQQTETILETTDTIKTIQPLQTTRFGIKFYMDKQINRTKTYTYFKGDSAIVENIETQLPYTKSHRLHLNVARAETHLKLISSKRAVKHEEMNYTKLIIKESKLRSKYKEAKNKKTFIPIWNQN